MDLFPAVLTRENVRTLPQEPITFIVHDALIPALVDWLDSRGAQLVRVPVEPEVGPTYVASPRSMGPITNSILREEHPW